MRTALRQTAKRVARALGIRRSPSDQQKTIDRDVRDFDARYRDILAQHPSPSQGAGDALGNASGDTLIVALHGHVPTLKTEGCLAKGLQARGMRIRPLIYQSDRNARKIYATFGITDVLAWEDFLNESDRGGYKHRVSDFVEGGPGFEDWLGFEHHGSIVGEHAMSWVVRQQHAGQIDLADPRTLGLFRQALVDGMLAVDAACRLFDELSPKLVLFCERGYTPFGDLFDSALRRNLNVVQWLGSHTDHALHAKRYTWDTRTAHPISLHTKTWQAVTAMDLPEDQVFIDDFKRRYETGDYNNRHNLQKGKRILPREELASQLGLDPNKKTAVIFSHILWDATFFYGKGLFPDYAQWLVETIKSACVNDQVNWLIKLHPINVWRLALDGCQEELAEHVLIRECVGKLPGHIKTIDPDTPINTASLWGAIDYALTVRGTVGMELPMFGTTVLTAGTGRYAGLGFTVDSDTREQYLDRLANIQNIEPISPQQVALARRHAQGIFGLRPLPFKSFTLSYPHGEYPAFLHPKVTINAPDIDTFAHAPDLQRFARWACEEDSLDLLGQGPDGGAA